MGLSRRQMARQIGCVADTLARWERHSWAPRKFHILRLQELLEMNAALDERGRQEMTKDFRPIRGAKGKLSRKRVRRMAQTVAALAIRRLAGSRFEVTASEYAVEKTINVQVAYDPQRKVYKFWLKKPPCKSPKRSKVTDASIQPN